MPIHGGPYAPLRRVGPCSLGVNDARAEKESARPTPSRPSIWTTTARNDPRAKGRRSFRLHPGLVTDVGVPIRIPSRHGGYAWHLTRCSTYARTSNDFGRIREQNAGNRMSIYRHVQARTTRVPQYAGRETYPPSFAPANQRQVLDMCASNTRSSLYRSLGGRRRCSLRLAPTTRQTSGRGDSTVQFGYREPAARWTRRSLVLFAQERLRSRSCSGIGDRRRS